MLHTWVMNDKAKALLERIVKLATNVHNLHGRYELSKEGYGELRGLVKEAMECLKATTETSPQSPAYAVGPGRWRIQTGVHGPVAVVATPQEYDTMDTSVTVSIYAMEVPTQEPMWKGYRAADVIALRAFMNGNSIDCYRLMGDQIEFNADFGHEESEWNELNLASGEESSMRGQGLRRPDEPDYKKLG